MKSFLVVAILFLALGFGGAVRAEDGCAPPDYTESTCDADCPQETCHDVSFNQDGSLFQCCPPLSVPELPAWVNPFYLALFLSIGFLAYRSRQQKLAPVRNHRS